MIAAVLTTMLFAVSAISSSRAARLMGPIDASFVRLAIATTLLALYAFNFGQGLAGPGLAFFLLSGLIGFGVGDNALFYAYQKLGARLAILLAQCLAVPFAAVTEWLWLGTVLTEQIPWMLLILAGVCLALLPPKKQQLLSALSWSGIAFGVVAALAQGWGAVLSRKAISINEAALFHVDGATASFQRIVAGVVISACLLWFLKTRRNSVSVLAAVSAPRPARLPMATLCLANAISGPVLGVSCYQWALASAPSAVVLAIVATTPIVVLPLAWLLENDRPTRVSMLGSFIAIAGIVGLLSR
ncbi:DMT family transporter [Steroidobacter sp.]|uniref:DMT family transporter n=1 Tax=Steroidobacter sp. TaxID=1978227 RepID=UPI001A569596|nr:DMT family transporter [Steroidobacter sp.]MBL8269708.1 DMT family transporter [Steroidobacter sp.]